jgi:hypothetical protein
MEKNEQEETFKIDMNFLKRYCGNQLEKTDLNHTTARIFVNLIEKIKQLEDDIYS